MMNARKNKVQFGGTFAGPTLVVTCSKNMLPHLAYDLSQIPTLPWMRGALILAETPNRASDDQPDAMLDLTAQKNATHFNILQACKDLGMITGRGVPKKSAENFALAS